MKRRLIALAGRARSGKDTVAEMAQAALMPQQSVLRAFAAPLKEICQQVFDFSIEQVYGAAKELPDPRYPRGDGTFLTPRFAMQVLGTEFGRACYPEIWVEMMLRKVKEAHAMGRSVVITDCRFVNEAKAVKAAGGKVWRILRPEADAPPARHVSEKEIDTPEFKLLVDRLIPNAHSLDELKVVVEKALEELE